MRSKADMDKAIELARDWTTKAGRMEPTSLGSVELARALLAATDELERIRPVYEAAVRAERGEGLLIELSEAIRADDTARAKTWRADE